MTLLEAVHVDPYRSPDHAALLGSFSALGKSEEVFRWPKPVPFSLDAQLQEAL